MSAIVIDLDDFKGINHTFGQLEGDRLLKTFVGLIKETVRSYDAIYRYSGDDIGIFLPETPLAAAAIIAERIREGAQVSMPALRKKRLRSPSALELQKAK